MVPVGVARAKAGLTKSVYGILAAASFTPMVAAKELDTAPQVDRVEPRISLTHSSLNSGNLVTQVSFKELRRAHLEEQRMAAPPTPDRQSERTQSGQTAADTRTERGISSTAPQPAAERSSLEAMLTDLRERAYEIAGQSVVDLTVAGISLWALARAALRLQVAAHKRFFPDQISVYLIEPIIGSHGDARLSTRTLSRLQLDEIYRDDPKALRLVRKAQRAAARHPELPILFFSNGSTAEVFTNLNKHMSGMLCGTDSALTAMGNATKRLASLAASGTMQQGIEQQVPMQRVFLLYTFERYDAVRTRVVWLPADDVISLLGDTKGWFNACMNIRDERIRNSTAQRLVRHIEIATSIVLRRPDLVEGYCRESPDLWQKVESTARDMRKLLALPPSESLRYLRQYLEGNPELDTALTPKEERWLNKIWYGKADAVRPDTAARDWLTYIEVPACRATAELSVAKAA